MRRTILTLVAGLWCLSAAAARAQYDSDLERPQVGAPNPEGRPNTYRAWAPLSYYIWHDAGGWHLRSTTSGTYHMFAGQVQASEGVYNVRGSDPSVPLNIVGNTIGFGYGLQGGEKGFDWAGNGPMTFLLTVDGRERPEKVRIGYGEQRPFPGRFQVFPGGMAVAGGMAGGEEAVPAAEDDYGDVQNAEGPEVDPASFQEVLSPYGTWVDAPGYGSVWRPQSSFAGPDWSPYSYGHWVYTDLGWTWVSDYAWGWAPFHYGNWVFVDGGWGWIPGRVWAPAWVEWRYGGGYVGWGPCAPVGLSVAYTLAPSHFAFVTVEGFTATGSIHGSVIHGERAVELHRQTQGLAGATYVNGHAVVPVNAGPSPHAIGAATGHPVVPVQAASLHAVHPPAGAKGVHYPAGASASHPFATHPLPAAVAKQYVSSQPKAAQQQFNQSRQVTRGGIQPGHAISTSAPTPAPTAHPAGSAQTGSRQSSSQTQERSQSSAQGGARSQSGSQTPERSQSSAQGGERSQGSSQPQERSQESSQGGERSQPGAQPQERSQQQQQQQPKPKPPPQPQERKKR